MGETECGYACEILKNMRLYAESIVSDIEASSQNLHEATVRGDIKAMEDAYEDLVRNVMDYGMWANIMSVTKKFFIYTGDLKVADRESIETAIMAGMIEGLKKQFDEALAEILKKEGGE